MTGISCVIGLKNRGGRVIGVSCKGLHKGGNWGEALWGVLSVKTLEVLVLLVGQACSEVDTGTRTTGTGDKTLGVEMGKNVSGRRKKGIGY
jgi:hypothetical protein